MKKVRQPLRLEFQNRNKGAREEWIASSAAAIDVFISHAWAPPKGQTIETRKLSTTLD